MKSVKFAAIFLLIFCFFANNVWAEKRFMDSVGNVQVDSVKTDSEGYTIVPYILWGADIVTFYANGGLKTTPNSIYGKLGLKIKLVQCDDTVKQSRDYLSGKSPFLRMTFRQGGVASEVMGSDHITKGVTLMQMSFSGGDHLVVRSEMVKRISDMKGKSFIMMYNAPQIGMMDDLLKTAQLTWNDVKIIWVKDISGQNGPAETMRRTPEAAGAFVITPDMFGLTGSINTTGTGGDNTLKGAKVLVSTQNEMSRSIWDGYFCRKDWFDKNREWAHKFVAGYMKATEEVLVLKNDYETKGSKTFMDLLEMSQKIYGKDDKGEYILPTLEIDAYGLLADARLVGYPGNVVFFEEEGNMAGFVAFQKSALDLAVNQGYAKERMEFLTSGLDYSSNYFVGYLKNTNVKRENKFRAEAMEAEIASLNAGELDDRKIDFFTIQYPPEANDFDEVKYGKEFQRTIEWASKYGEAGVAIRGHADPTWTIIQLIKAGIAKGIIKQSGTKGNYTYYFNGKPLSLENTDEVVELIKSGQFDGVAQNNPREAMGAASALSKSRAQGFVDGVIKYAEKNHITFDASQLVPVGVGITEPLIAKPSNMKEAQKNMRAEITLIRLSAEVKSDKDFDY